MTLMIVLIALLLIKHFIADFVYQPPYQWQNKGTYLHPGGLLHSFQHVVLTGFILVFFKLSFVSILSICIIEFLVHYHMDWFKMWYNKKKDWGANTHNEFWILMGFDQLVHNLTYVWVVAQVFEK